jgi:hypothetical protein
MSIREYYKLNKESSKLIFRGLSIGLTCIFLLLFLAFAMDNKRTFLDGIYVILICFFLGNLMALSILSAIFSIGFSQVNSQIELFSKIPSEIKKVLGLKLVYKPLISKYSFLELTIVGFDDTSFIFFNYDKSSKCVWITIQNMMKDIADFNAEVQYIDKKYKKDSVVLTGWGLRKEIKWKRWLKMNENDVKDEIGKLYTISENENIRVQKIYEKINWS